MMTKEQTESFYFALEYKLDANRAELIEKKYMVLSEDDMCIEFKGESFRMQYNMDTQEYQAVVYAANKANIPLYIFGL